MFRHNELAARVERAVNLHEGLACLHVQLLVQLLVGDSILLVGDSILLVEYVRRQRVVL